MKKIIHEGRNAWRCAHADDSGTIVDAADYYRSFYFSAREAKRYILMSGWQFDSGVKLLRGEDAPPGAEVHFLKFLVGLCRKNPQLDIYILAWNYHPVLLGEREWLQRLRFSFRTSSRIHFRFDDCPLPGGSHHQKFVVIDDSLAYLGGIDLCEARWDDRRHCAKNSVRLSRGRPQKPYHDVQAYLTGKEAVGAVTELFAERWERCAEGGKLELPTVESRPPKDAIRAAVDMGPAQVAFSRTDPRSEDDIVREVEHLFLDAIESAERLIYIETQYFSSRDIYAALRDRMRAAGRPKPEIVIIVNERAEAPKEELAVGLRQAQNLECLRKVAADSGTQLGVYYSVCDGADETFRATYIHSKVMAVDDRFFTVGSANATNRSMALDSELHVSWEVPADELEGRLGRAIKEARVDLLRELSGLTEARDLEKLGALEGIVAFLDEVAARPDARLQKHGPPSPAQELALEVIDPRVLPFDPEMPEEDAGFAHHEPMDERYGWPIQIPALGKVIEKLRPRAFLPAPWRREA